MKRVAVCLIGCLLLVAFSSFAFAGGEQKSKDKADGYYVTLLGGVGFLNDADITDSTIEDFKVTSEFDTGYLFGLALGYKHDTQRLEGEFSYQKNDFDKWSSFADSVDTTGDTSAFTFLFNYYFDIPTKYPIKPFLTAGVGVSRIEINDLGFPEVIGGEIDESDTVFAYQFGFGASWAMSRSLDLELKYRYFGTQDPSFDTIDAEYSSHNVILGLRIAL